MKEWEIETETGFVTWFARSQGTAETQFHRDHPHERIVGIRLVGPAPDWAK